MTRIELQVSDVVAAQRLHMRPSLRVLVLVAALVIVMVVVIAVLISGRLTSALYPAVLVAAVTAVVLWSAMYLLYLPWLARRMYRQHKMLRDASEISWDEHGITCRSAAAHSTIAWEDYVKWKEGEHLFLVYLADRLFQMVPKRVFASAAEEQDFRRHLPRIGATLRSGRRP